MIKTTQGLLDFWEEQMRQSHRSSNYFFRKSPSHYHMMLIVMAAYKSEKNMFRVVRCCDDTERPIKYYFNSPEEYEKASGNTVTNVVKKSWERSNRNLF